MADRQLILVTNDDGIGSAGLRAAAAALAPLGELLIAAPHQQATAAGRSMPASASGRISAVALEINGQPHPAYAVEAMPAQVVQHAVLELAPRQPDLVVSGINYGENVGSGVTISGTVGAALEGAAFGLPALAVSLELDHIYHYSNSEAVDFSAAAHFTALFAGLLLARPGLPDVDVLKVEVPELARPDSPWRFTRLSRLRYYDPIRPVRDSLNLPGKIGYQITTTPGQTEPDSDVRALLEGVVAVTPLSLDITSRVDLRVLERHLLGQPGKDAGASGPRPPA